MFAVPVVLCAAFIVTTSTVRADVLVFDSFGPGNSYDTGHRWLVEPVGAAHGYQGRGEAFTPGISGYLSMIQLATLQQSGSPLGNFTIAQDNGSGLPGTVLESFNNVLNQNGITTITSVAKPLLQAGQTYWLTDDPITAGGVNAWAYNNQGLTGADAYETTGGPGVWFNLGVAGTTDGVFSISVVPVPEPASVGLLLLGGGLLAARRSRAV
jgi:hypothetical protein